MLAVGMLLIWGGYDVTLFGWCLFRDYDVTLGQLSSPLHPYAGAWPPSKIPPGRTWPGKSSTSGGQSSGPAGPAKPGILGTIKKGVGGILTGGL